MDQILDRSSGAIDALIQLQAARCAGGLNDDDGDTNGQDRSDDAHAGRGLGHDNLLVGV